MNKRHCDTTRSFTKNLFNNKISLDEADENQVELLIQIIDFKKKTKPKNAEKKNHEKSVNSRYRYVSS